MPKSGGIGNPNRREVVAGRGKYDPILTADTGKEETQHNWDIDSIRQRYGGVSTVIWVAGMEGYNTPKP